MIIILVFLLLLPLKIPRGEVTVKYVCMLTSSCKQNSLIY